MRKVISILTATRAEFGILKPLIAKLNKENDFEIKIVVTGAHLVPEFGLTYKEIENVGFEIDEKIEILLGSDTPTSISKSMGLAMISFAEYFERIKPDMLIVLGDRYETLAVVTSAMNLRIPIAHLHGGEITEGALDDGIRHAITKLSYLHFTSCDEHKNRVIQLGEDPKRVFNVGALGVENILKEKLMSKDEILKSLDISGDKPYGVVTFHPVTLENESVSYEVLELFKALAEEKDMNFIITKANADAEGRIINGLIDEFALKNDNIIAHTSLGMVRYLSSLKYCEMVIGNSSSGIIEAPSFKIPTINIGNRQKGRLQATSVINCLANYEDIKKAIVKAKGKEFKEIAKDTINPYGNGNTSDKIVEEIKNVFKNNSIDLKKIFYNLEV